jgi:hypothetical protein
MNLAANSRSALAWSIVVFALSQAYLLPKVLHVGDGHDFRLIWLAGRLWSAGINPYDPGFVNHYLEQFGPGPTSHFWVYPPNWWLPSILLSSLSFQTSVLLWNIISHASLLGGCWLTAVGSCPPRSKARLPTFFLVSAFASTMQDTTVTIAIGQTSLVVFLGASLFSFGWKLANSGLDRQRQASVLLGVGLYVLALKPNIGIMFFAAALTQRQFLRPALLAGGLAALSCLPTAVIFGIEESWTSFARALRSYGADGIVANAPPNMTGLQNLADLMGLALPTSPLIALALVLVVLASLSGRLRTHLPEATVALAFSIVPLHSYDLVGAALVIPLASFPVSFTTLVASFGLAALWRPANLASISDVQHPDSGIFPGSLIASIGITVVAAAILVRAWTKGRARCDEAPRPREARP